VTESTEARPAIPARSNLEKSSLSRILEVGPKVAAASLALVYVLGLISVNTYLSQFGFQEYSLVRGQYLLAGAWAAALLVLTSLPILVGWWSVYGQTPTGLARRKGYRLRGFSALMIPLVSWMLIFHSVEPASRWDALLAEALVPCFLVALCLIGAVYLMGAFIDISWIGGRIDNQSILARDLLYWGNLMSGFFGLIFFAPSLFTLIWLFSNAFYDKIPSALGGGSPVRARLLIKSENSSSLVALGLEFPPDTQISFPLDILIQTDKVTYVRTGSGNILQLNNEAVAGISIKGRSGEEVAWELKEIRNWESKINQQLIRVKAPSDEIRFEKKRDDILERAGLKLAGRYPDNQLNDRDQDENWQCAYGCGVSNLHDEYLEVVRHLENQNNR
jgi:hypothetical protein